MYFIVHGNPQGKARARTVRDARTGISRTYTPKKTVEYEQRIREAYLVDYEEREPLNGAIKIEIYAMFPIPKNTSKKDKALMLYGGLHPTKKPDCDNIAKVVCDALNNVAYHDDKQITSLYVTKGYVLSPDGYIAVSIKEISE